MVESEEVMNYEKPNHTKVCFISRHVTLLTRCRVQTTANSQ